MWIHRIFLSAILLLGAATGAQAQQPILIGLSGPFSGGSAPMGESMRNGVRLAVEEINGIGGINGRRIELLERDDRADNALGARIAAEFTQRRVAAAIGIVNTGVGLASIDAYQQARIPLMVAVSTGTALTQKFAPPAAAENYIFRVAPTLDLEARVLAADLKRRGLQAIALLADDTAYGAAGLAAMREQARAAGLNLVAEQRFELGMQDAAPQVRQARAAGAQALVAWGIGPELAVIARARQALGWNVALAGSWTLSMRNFIDAAGAAGEGALMPQTFIQEAGSTSKNSFLLAYGRSFKTDRIASPMSAAQGYDGMRLLHLALLQANSTDGPKIRAALESLNARYQGAITSYRRPFTRSDHDAITQNMLVIGTVADRRIAYAYADDARRGALLRLKGQ